MSVLTHFKIGLRPIILTVFAFTMVSNANAHQVWLEQDDNNTVRIYLGEPGVPDSGDKIANLKDAQVFTDNRSELAVLSQENDHWEGTVGVGDVRLFTDKVWEPWAIDNDESKASWWKFWEGEPENLQGAILQARAGRVETNAMLTYELVPTITGGDTFIALFNGSSLAEQEISLLSPSKKEVTLTTDADGRVDVSSFLTEQGRFVLESVHTIEIDAVHSGKKVDSLMYISTLSFIVN